VSHFVFRAFFVFVFVFVVVVVVEEISVFFGSCEVVYSDFRPAKQRGVNVKRDLLGGCFRANQVTANKSRRKDVENKAGRLTSWNWEEQCQRAQEPRPKPRFSAEFGLRSQLSLTAVDSARTG